MDAKAGAPGRERVADPVGDRSDPDLQGRARRDPLGDQLGDALVLRAGGSRRRAVRGAIGVVTGDYSVLGERAGGQAGHVAADLDDCRNPVAHQGGDVLGVGRPLQPGVALGDGREHERPIGPAPDDARHLGEVRGDEVDACADRLPVMS